MHLGRYSTKTLHALLNVLDHRRSVGHIFRIQQLDRCFPSSDVILASCGARVLVASARPQVKIHIGHDDFDHDVNVLFFAQIGQTPARTARLPHHQIRLQLNEPLTNPQMQIRIVGLGYHRGPTTVG